MMAEFPALSRDHLSMLRDDSGLSDEVIAERGYYTATTFKELRDLGFSERQSRAPALVIPLHNVDGVQVGHQIRPDSPRSAEDGKLIKYETPRGNFVSLDVPPRCQPLLGNPSVPLYITEGSKKADALANQGVCTIALLGVWNWRGTNKTGGTTALADWESVALNGRSVRIVFDSDVATKGPVAAAMSRLKSFLERRQADVQIIYLPPLEDGSKQGIDDFLVAGGSIADLATLVSTDVAVAKKPKPGNRSEIVTTNRYLRDIAQDCWAVVVQYNETQPRLFQRGGRLARIDEPEGGPIIRSLGEADIHGLLERLADFVKLAKKGDEWVRQPARLAKDVGLDILAAWHKPVPLLKGLVATPIVSSDGAIIVAHGYHPQSGLFHWTNGHTWKALPEQTNEGDVRRARDLIDEWLCDFPFADPASRANTIAMVLTYMARELIAGVTPLFVLSAPTQGTGKGLIAQTAGIIMQGRSPAVMTETRSGEEWRKRFTSALLEGRRIILIDNVKRRLDSAELAAVLTSDVWTDRLLSTNEMVSPSNRAVWIATGNNIAMDGEIARRSVLVRMDAKKDRPWEGRVFRNPDLPAWVRENRHELVRAFLILIRHWIALGRPAWLGSRLGSFESWSEVIGGILQSARIEGFMENRNSLYVEADRESTEWREFVETWHGQFGEAAVKVADLVPIIHEKDQLAALVAASGGEPTIQQLKVRLGKALALRTDRTIGHWSIRWLGKDSHSKAQMYRLEPAEVEGSVSGPSADLSPAFQAKSGSSAEDAEGAEGVSRAHARSTPIESLPDPFGAKAIDEEPIKLPHPPHPPQTDSKPHWKAAEDYTGVPVADGDLPRCRKCHRTMSIIAISDTCGSCKRDQV